MRRPPRWHSSPRGEEARPTPSDTFQPKKRLVRHEEAERSPCSPSWCRRRVLGTEVVTMRRTMFLLMALAAVSSDAAVLCTAKSGSGTVRVRTTCRRREKQLDPAALDLQGPPGRGTAFEASADTPPGSPSPLDAQF